MKFLEVIKQLQEDKLNEGYLILIQNGIFFTGIGKDAVIMHDILGTQTICLKEDICKTGVPVKSIEKYINLLARKDISFVLYKYLNSNKNLGKDYEQIFRFSGNRIFEKRESIRNCKECNKRKETEQEIMERLKKNGK